ncbi:MAG TPA: zf-HC2 domain-containing protein [Pyrinomonadaceae bacterium]|jgi:anti-sigma factor RsiW
MLTRKDNCPTDLIAAYIDGDLDQVRRVAFEEHLSECKICENELRMQRSFMCELDAALDATPHLAVPQDFARIVAAHAESDMSGARSGAEHRIALRLCLVLAFVSFALLGFATSKSILSSAQLIATKIVGVVTVLGKALYDAGVGVTVIVRVVSNALLPDAFSVLVLLLLVLGILLLSLLISSYHRYHRRGLYE